MMPQPKVADVLGNQGKRGGSAGEGRARGHGIEPVVIGFVGRMVM